MTPNDDAAWLGLLEKASPATLAQVDAAIEAAGRRHEDIEHLLAGVKHDEERGHYVRLMFCFRDGGLVVVDSLELAALVTPAGSVQ
jgi:hypothetical protein